MVLRLGQLIYTSFAGFGFKVLSSSQVPDVIQHLFLHRIVYQYWNEYRPPDFGYRAAFIHQVNADYTLFGWVYNDGLDDLGRGYVPYFVCYALTETLGTAQLEIIFRCLQHGPLTWVDRQALPESLAEITIPDTWSDQAVAAGVTLPPQIREQAQLTLQHQKLLTVLVPHREQTKQTPSVGVLFNPQTVHRSTVSAGLFGVNRIHQGARTIDPAIVESGALAIHQLFDHRMGMREIQITSGETLTTIRLRWNKTLSLGS
jgi:hypothetical protein